MDLSWVALWIQLLLATRIMISYWRAFLTCGAILLFSYYLDELNLRRNIHAAKRRVIILGVMLISVVFGLVTLLNPGEWQSLKEFVLSPVQSFNDVAVSIPGEFLVIVASLMMSWRGLSLVGAMLEPESIIGRFRTGIIMLFIFGLVVHLRETSPGFSFYLFIFSSLVGISAARIASQAHMRGGKTIPFDRKWMAAILLTTSLVVGLAYWAVSWLRSGGLETIFTVYSWIISILVFLISPLLWAIAELLRLLTEFISFEGVLQILIALFDRLGLFISELMEFVRSWIGNLDRLINLSWLQPLKIPKSAVLWGTILFFVILILISLQKQRWKNIANEEEDLADIDQPDLFDLLRKGLRRAVDQLINQVDSMLGLRQIQRRLAAARVRRIYAQLLKLSARLDSPRRSSHTPLEFLPSLRGLFPDLMVELDAITKAYLHVRYGELPETANEVDQVERAWKLIQAEGQTKLREKRVVGQ